MIEPAGTKLTLVEPLTEREAISEQVYSLTEIYNCLEEVSGHFMDLPAEPIVNHPALEDADSWVDDYQAVIGNILGELDDVIQAIEEAGLTNA